MANIEDTRKLHLLADVALGTYSQEEQQPVPTMQEDHLPQDGQQPARATPRDNSPDDDEQSAQAPLSQGFTAINAATTTQTFALNNPQPPPPNTIASTGPPQGVTKKRSAARTTGFNKETGTGSLTSVCGRVTPAKGTTVAHRSEKNGNFRCPRCTGRFTRPRSVKDHFILCVGKYGNPAALRWFDHASLEKSRSWHLRKMEQDEEDEENDEEEDEDEEMQDEEQ